MKSYENISTWVVAYWHDIVVVILPESGIEIMLALGLLAAHTHTHRVLARVAALRRIPGLVRTARQRHRRPAQELQIQAHQCQPLSLPRALRGRDRDPTFPAAGRYSTRPSTHCTVPTVGTVYSTVLVQWIILCMSWDSELWR